MTKKQLVATKVRNIDLILLDLYLIVPRVYSVDSTLSVMDVEKKIDLVAESEDQDDEFLSIVAIKGFVKFL